MDWVASECSESLPLEALAQRLTRHHLLVTVQGRFLRWGGPWNRETASQILPNPEFLPLP